MSWFLFFFPFDRSLSYLSISFRERVAFGLPSPVFFSGDISPDVRASPLVTVALSAPLAGL
ncbi:unnamed protein product [Brassica oleracea]|uniref:Uncharacterized protein n=2 Tax=Brassica TaxID=3705 RepID=A0A3P6AIK0_BRAOL|nr:unnamed protein product [Brassica napus]VDC91387.1 unnamed protein product [Brassica oleracea]